MGSISSDWSQRRVFLFSHPRTASNLLIRLLSGQPDWRISDYIFFDAFQYTRDNFDGINSVAQLPQAVRSEHDALIDQGHKQLDQFLTCAARDQKHALIKDHSLLVTPVAFSYGGANEKTRCGQLPNGLSAVKSTVSNPTIFSNEYMLSWRPIILIRNPVAVYESWLRAEGEPYPNLDSGYSKIYTTMKFQRRIFDWYHQCSTTSDFPGVPIVIDADDLMENRVTIQKLCDILDMDKEKLIYQWSAETPSSEGSEGNERYKRFLQTIRSSTGVDRSKIVGNVDISKKEREWAEMFGATAAATLARRVRDSWPDYEYLRNFRLA